MRLVDAEILKELEGFRPRSFFASEIMDIAYGDIDMEHEGGNEVDDGMATTIDGDASGR
jgi:hypothetical protein